MYQYTCLNAISPVGLGRFTKDYQKAEDIKQADAVLVRSANMHEMDLPENILAIARAGAGVNNIPLEDCARKGVVVFNTPGANANGVKEMVLPACSWQPEIWWEESTGYLPRPAMKMWPRRRKR